MFGVEHILDKFDHLRYCCERFCGRLTERIVPAQSRAPMKRSQLNLYYNDSIANTRCHHIDCKAKRYKAFLYLTDVMNFDIPLPPGVAMPLFGPTGTIAISQQTGMHGGIPKNPGGSGW